MKRLLPLLLITSCATAPMIYHWGHYCSRKEDPAERLVLVKKIAGTHDKNGIKVLIDCFEEALRTFKNPKPDPHNEQKTPAMLGPELWGLWTLTRQEFGLDIRQWRNWWIQNSTNLVWNSDLDHFVVVRNP